MALNIESSSEDNNSSSKNADFYDDLLDKEHALEIHEALEDQKLEKKFLVYTFLILSIQFAFIFVFSLVGFFTDFNEKIVQDEEVSFGILFLTTIAIHPYWYWIYRFKKDNPCLLFHNFTYIILFTIYFYSLSYYIDKNYVLTVEALILLNAITLIVHFYISSKFDITMIIVYSFVANIIGMIPFSFTLLKKKGGVIASISGVDIGIILFFILFTSQIKYKNVISCEYCMSSKNKEFFFSPLTFNFFIQCCTSAFLIGFIIYAIIKHFIDCARGKSDDCDFGDDDDY